MDARDVLPLYRERGDCENVFDFAASPPVVHRALPRHARQGIVTIYTATSEKAREIYRAINAFLSRVASASQLGVEQRRHLIMAYAFRKYGTIRRLFPPLIGSQMTMPLA